MLVRFPASGRVWPGLARTREGRENLQHNSNGPERLTRANERRRRATFELCAAHAEESKKSELQRKRRTAD
jgi:hypothetical protein